MATTTICSMFDEQTGNLLKNVRVIDKSVSQDHREKDQDTTRINENGPSVKAGISCSVCEITEFDSVKAQREHFKLDWHRFNVKQRLMNKPVITEEDFEETISGEVSSISGSDSSDSEDSSDEDFEMERTTHQELPESFPTENEDKENSKLGRSHPKLFLLSDDGGYVFTVYRATVFSPKNVPEKELDVIKEIKMIREEPFWVVIMTAGGHFAAAVFDGKSVVVHKTFHRYTVRAKRGTAQGIRDNQQGIQTRSAGASLRRHNEAALVQDVQELLQSWSEYLERCHKIFIRIPTYNKPMFFGGKNSLLNKSDPRIRTIPFSTRRPTFKEVKRVQEELSKVQILGQESEVLDEVLQQLSPQKPHPTPGKVNNMADKTDLSSTTKNTENTSSEVMNESQTESFGHEIEDLSEDVTRCASISGKKGKKKKSNYSRYGQEKVSAATRCPDREVVLPDHHLWNRFYCAVVSGNAEVVAQLLPNKDSKHHQTSAENIVCEESTHSEPDQAEFPESLILKKESDLHETVIDECKHETAGDECKDETAVDPNKMLNECWGEGGSTLLHAASRASQTEIMYTLLNHGADPCIRDDSGKTPYDRAKSKDARDQFRQFMADHPNAFDYSKSHIPSPLTQEMKEEKERKESEKKKAQRKAKKLRAKEQKVNEQKKQEEEMERKKKETMSEREKRALAAEKRFAKQHEKNSGLSCAMCSQDLTGRVPFERLTYKYCSTQCVRQHRLILENKGR